MTKNMPEFQELTETFTADETSKLAGETSKLAGGNSSKL